MNSPPILDGDLIEAMSVMLRNSLCKLVLKGAWHEVVFIPLLCLNPFS